MNPDRLPLAALLVAVTAAALSCADHSTTGPTASPAVGAIARIAAPVLQASRKGGGGGGGGGGGHSSSLTVRDFAFSPTPDTVPPGTMVTFTWAAGSTVHNVTWDTGPTTPLNSADMSSGAYTTPALSAGTYTYHCTFHASLYNMRGTIVVK